MALGGCVISMREGPDGEELVAEARAAFMEAFAEVSGQAYNARYVHIVFRPSVLRHVCYPLRLMSSMLRSIMHDTQARKVLHRRRTF